MRLKTVSLAILKVSILASFPCNFKDFQCSQCLWLNALDRALMKEAQASVKGLIGSLQASNLPVNEGKDGSSQNVMS